MKKLMVLLLIFFCISLYAQDNPQAIYKKHSVRIHWDYDTTGTIFDYYVFAIRGNDTTQFANFNFRNGASYNDVWALQIGSTLYNYYHFELQNITHANWIKFGVMGVGLGMPSDSLIVTPAIRWRKPTLLPSVIKVD